jgi:hypothetical protein
MVADPSSDKATQMLAEIQSWLATLPEGAATLEFLEENPYERVVRVRPLRSPKASPITLRLGRDGTADVAMGEGVEFNDMPVSPGRLEAICRAVADGSLTERLRLRAGRWVASRGELRLPGETLHSKWTKWGAFCATLLGGVEERTVNYEPYVVSHS